MKTGSDSANPFLGQITQRKRDVKKRREKWLVFPCSVHRRGVCLVQALVEFKKYLEWGPKAI